MNQLAVVGAKELVTAQDIEILKNSKFKGFTNEEIAFCAKVSNQLMLSPFLNQIHFVKRKNKDGTSSVTPQVAIDGFRLAALRAGGYAGSDDIVFEYGTNKARPLKATATVYKVVGGIRCPFIASARWEEFYNPNGGMWDKLPHQMLGKCAEAQALRKAFPAELSGLYTPEEMSQADAPGKAQTIQDQIAPKEAPPIETEHREVGDEEPAPDQCSLCGSSNVMDSRYHENTRYCKSCKKTSAKGAA